ncbi:MAG: nicotinamide-nucleotide amidohydrolase family protein, partial [Bdellovibrionales bacterium]|nr:nicotinamide-nucleotide amidohydrolase family protein [Bdellovibrionales bacterium]
RPLEATPAAIRHVKDRYAARKLPLTPARRRLARIPRGATLIENPSGTAPGFWIERPRSRICFLPGVPSECRPMFLASVLPETEKIFPLRRVHTAFWRTFGWGESRLYQEIAPLVARLEKKYPHTFRFGVHISFPCIDLSLEVLERGKRPSQKEIAALTAHIDKTTEQILVTRERKSIPEVVFDLLRNNRLTLSAAESCTGGLLGKTLTDFPGSSHAFVGGVVSYANSAKQQLLGVQKQTLENHGAVSQSAVEEMAQGIRQRLGTDYAIALSGISGPGGGTPDKPVGTIYVAILGPRRSKTLHQVILNGQGSRDQNRVIAMNLALDALRLMILDDLG